MGSVFCQNELKLPYSLLKFLIVQIVILMPWSIFLKDICRISVTKNSINEINRGSIENAFYI